MKYYTKKSFFLLALFSFIVSYAPAHLAAPLQLEIKKSHVRFVFGNNTPQLVSGLSTTPLGGLSVADELSRLRYGVALGKVDKNKTITDLHYGDGAARAWADIKISPRLALDGLYQRASGYEQLGVGGTYDSELLGSWAVNLTQSQHSLGQGWRYQGRYDVGLSSTLDLSLRSENYVGAFSSLLQSQSLAVTTAQSKYGLNLQWDSGRWGKFGASYATALPRLGQKEHQFGFNQQFWYSPNLRIDVDAQRQTHSGDYNVGLRFSLPMP